MCKCCQYCLESCYWHLIEKRFCYDESIALYEVPGGDAGPQKEEKNNNSFDNMAFYDSVAVIAGRAVVTISPLPSPLHHLDSQSNHNEKITPEEERPIVRQPTRRLRWEGEEEEREREEEVMGHPSAAAAAISTSPPFKRYLSSSEPVIYDSSDLSQDELDSAKVTSAASSEDLSDSAFGAAKGDPVMISAQKLLQVPQGEGGENGVGENGEGGEDVEGRPRRKSLRERRMSKSLYLRIDPPNKELPIIRQQSMPKFYLDTPSDEHQTMVTSMFRSPSTTLMSPVPTPNSRGFVYDLYSVVQMERERAQQRLQQLDMQPAPIHRDATGSRLSQIKEKIRLRRVKSSLGVVTNLPHSHHHI